MSGNDAVIGLCKSPLKPRSRVVSVADRECGHEQARQKCPTPLGPKNDHHILRSMAMD